MLVVDDHAVVRQALVRLLEKEPDLEVAGEAADGFEAVRLAQDLRPDIVLMDLYMPGLDGVEATRQIKRNVPGCEVVVLTASEEEADVIEALRAGARGYILKTSDARTFLTQIGEVASGRVPMAPEVTAKLIAGLSAQRAPPQPRVSGRAAVLTSREGQVLELISRGLTNKQIAEALAISKNTAHAHLRSLLQKVGVENRTSLAIRALREGRPESGRGGSPAMHRVSRSMNDEAA